MDFTPRALGHPRPGRPLASLAPAAPAAAHLSPCPIKGGTPQAPLAHNCSWFSGAGHPTWDELGQAGRLGRAPAPGHHGQHARTRNWEPCQPPLGPLGLPELDCDAVVLAPPPVQLHQPFRNRGAWGSWPRPPSSSASPSGAGGPGGPGPAPRPAPPALQEQGGLGAVPPVSLNPCPLPTSWPRDSPITLRLWLRGQQV